MNILVNVSYCQGHYKGQNPDVAERLRGDLHARWLYDAVSWWEGRDNLLFGMGKNIDVAVSSTDWPGILHVEAGDERDYLWDVHDTARFVLTEPSNPGHQVGAALTIRLGLECAHKLGYDCLIHTAEDVAPRWSAVLDMIRSIENGSDYCGEAWGASGEELNAQFFACRPSKLAGPWDACSVTGHGCIERYLYHLCEQKGLSCRAVEKGFYRTTHDYEQWKRWMKEGG